MNRMNTILVTGGSGFIGSHFIKYLIKKQSNSEIFNLDALTYAGDRGRLDELRDNRRYHFIKCDLRDKKRLSRTIKEIKPDIIFHFASETHVDNSINSPEDFVYSNIVGTFNLLECIKEREALLIHISTDEVYGDRRPDERLFSESSIFNPSSPYSATKASQEMLIRAYARTYNLRSITIRPCNNFGPFQNPEKFIPKCILNAIENEPIPIYGNGKNLREWIYVEDTCEAIWRIFKKGKIGESYNIGSGILISNLEMAKRILKILNRTDDLITFVPDRKGHDRAYGVDYSRLKRLGFERRTELMDGLRVTIEWYSNNRDRFIKTTRGKR